MGPSIVIPKHWTCGESFFVKVRDDNGFQVPIKIALNSDLQTCATHPHSPQPHRTTAKLPVLLDVAGGISGIWLPPLTSSSISHLQKEADFIGPMNISPRCKISSVAYLTPFRTRCFLCLYQKGMFNFLRSSVKWPYWESRYKEYYTSTCWRRFIFRSLDTF